MKYWQFWLGFAFTGNQLSVTAQFLGFMITLLNFNLSLTGWPLKTVSFFEMTSRNDLSCRGWIMISSSSGNTFTRLVVTLSRRRPLSYRNQSIDLQSKSMDWFLYDNGLRHERVKQPIIATGWKCKSRFSQNIRQKILIAIRWNGGTGKKVP